MNPLRRLLSMPNDAPAKTLAVAFAVSLACSILVATTAVLLRPRQLANRRRDREAQVTAIVERLPGAAALLEPGGAARLEARVVELSSGLFADQIDPLQLDPRRDAGDPRWSVAIPPEHDLARIQRRARYATVYLLRGERGIELVILPVYGAGYASTMHGFLALDGGAERVVALRFYEHGETPGMGAAIADPRWQRQWEGKRVFDETGAVRLGVASGPGEPDAAAAPFEVDAMSGATRTGRGVTGLLHFWLGEWGFGPFLKRIRPS